jgi:protein-tyrosine-phosphatase
MFEFRRDPETGHWDLLEVNARPWGSLPLPVGLGVDFPHAWYRLLVEGVRPEPQAYRPQVYARNLELHVDFALKTLGEMGGLVRRMRFLGQWSAGLARIPAGREKIDSWARDDMAPGIAELHRLASRLGRRAMRGLPVWPSVRKFIARARMRRAVGAAMRGGAAKIVFVCYGNICRSAFAERALIASLQGCNGEIRVLSAGTYPADGRHSPREAVEASQQHSVDLASHRSRHVTAELVAEASLVVVFDRANIEALRAQLPGISCPVIQLGALVKAPEIADPYGQGQAAFERVFAMIDRGVQVLRGCIVEAAARAHA